MKFPVFAASVLAIGAVLIAGCGEDPQGSEKKLEDVPLSADVGIVAGTAVRILNKDPFPWTDCGIEINPHGFSSGFTRRMHEIGSQHHATLLMHDFADSDGRRFDPDQYKVSVVYVRCTTPEGIRSFYGTQQDAPSAE